MQTDDHNIYMDGYLEGAENIGGTGVLTDWLGHHLGTYKITSKWRIKSDLNNYMYQVDVRVNGVWYTGRGLGNGMCWHGKRKVIR